MTANRIKEAFLKRLDPQHRMRWLVMLVVILVFTAILYPGLVVTDLAYRIGDVAERDIKASRDLLIEDRQATETNQRNASEQSQTVYDNDVLLARNLTRNIDQVFSDMRKTIAELQARRSPSQCGTTAGRGCADRELRTTTITSTCGCRTRLKVIRFLFDQSPHGKTGGIRRKTRNYSSGKTSSNCWWTPIFPGQSPTA